MVDLNCSKCGAPLPLASNFCPACGKNLHPKRVGKRMRGNGQGTVYKRGRTWTASYTYGWAGPRPLKRTKGGFATKREAIDYLPILKSPVAAKRSSISFGALFDAWVPYYAPRIAEITMKGIKSAAKWFADINHLPIAELTIDDLQDCVDACPRSKRTKENMKYLAVQLYRYAAARKVLRDNIAEYIYCGKEDGGTRPAFTVEQLELIRKAVGKVPYADYAYCMIYLGFRPNEMLRLTADAYDAAHDCFIGGFKTEAGTDRNVTISPKIAPIIKARVAVAKPWVFPNKRGELMTDAEFREDCFYPLLAALGIQPIPDEEHPAVWKPYSCRHTFANLMKNAPGSDTDKASLMGHADPSMTKYYQSPDYDSIRAITNAM